MRKLYLPLLISIPMVLMSCRNETVVKEELETFDSLVIRGNLYGNVKGMKITSHRTNIIIGDTILCIIRNRKKIGEKYQMITKNCKYSPFFKVASKYKLSFYERNKCQQFNLNQEFINYEGTFYKCKYNMEKEIDAMIEAENGKLQK